MRTARPALEADITPEWIEAVAGALRDNGHATRPAADCAAIEVQSINTGNWHALQLPTNGSTFADATVRDLTLARLVTAAARS